MPARHPMDDHEHIADESPDPPSCLADAGHRSRRKPIEQPTWQNVVNVPARSNVTVRILFDDFTGRSVHHCYILDHEDLGMMGVIDVRR